MRAAFFDAVHAWIALRTELGLAEGDEALLKDVLLRNDRDAQASLKRDIDQAESALHGRPAQQVLVVSRQNGRAWAAGYS